MAHYLIITGDVEVAPGRFARGIVSSSSHPTLEAAQDEWARLSGPAGDFEYEEPWETHEIREGAPFLSECMDVTT